MLVQIGSIILNTDHVVVADHHPAREYDGSPMKGTERLTVTLDIVQGGGTRWANPGRLPAPDNMRRADVTAQQILFTGREAEALWGVLQDHCGYRITDRGRDVVTMTSACPRQDSPAWKPSQKGTD